MYLESTSPEASTCLNISVEVFVPSTKIELINEWLDGHGLALMTPDKLPETGFMLSEDGINVGCVFLYEDKSASTGWIEGCLANPFVDSGKVADNFTFALEYIEMYAQKIGIKEIVIFTSLFSHARKFIDNGYHMVNRCVALRKELI